MICVAQSHERLSTEKRIIFNIGQSDPSLNVELPIRNNSLMDLVHKLPESPCRPLGDPMSL